MFIPFVVSFLSILTLHVIIPQTKQKWFLIHCVVNTIITILTIEHVYYILFEPFNPIYGSSNVYPIVLVLVLHAYHMLCYSCVRLDYIHHIVMCSTLIFPLFYGSPRLITEVHFLLFFICGLPGAIDYYNMYCVYTGQLTLLAEKRYNTWLNMYIRALGIFYGIFTAWVMFRVDNQIPSLYNGFVLTTLFWNAQYFSREVCISYGRKLTDNE